MDGYITAEAVEWRVEEPLLFWWLRLSDFMQVFLRPYYIPNMSLFNLNIISFVKILSQVVVVRYQ